MRFTLFANWRNDRNADSRRTRLRLEILEARLLPSLTPHLLKDINPGAASSVPMDFTVVGAVVYFAAKDPLRGDELWKSNGIATLLVKDINPGSSGSYPANLTNVNGTLFFSANDGTHGVELWRSGGNALNTVMVKDIDPGFGSGLNKSQADFTNVNGTLFFQAQDGIHGVELWRSNGTAAGTVMVKDINPADRSSNPSYLTNVNGTLFFRASDVVHGAELWRSNGTAAGTVLVKDIKPGNSSSNPADLTNVNGTLFFMADDGVHGTELWRSNGSAPGTVLVKDINPGSAPGLFFMTLTNVNGTLFFSANDGFKVHGVELWRSNGTAAGTVMVNDIDPGTGSSLPSDLVNRNGSVFFQATDGVHGGELWGSNGTSAGTVMVKDIDPGSTGSYPGFMANINGSLFFNADDGVHGHELWESNGTAAGTTLVDIVPGAMSSYPAYFTNLNGTVFFSADDWVHGQEPWILGPVPPAVEVTVGTTAASSPNPGLLPDGLTGETTGFPTPMPGEAGSSNESVVSGPERLHCDNSSLTRTAESARRAPAVLGHRGQPAFPGNVWSDGAAGG
jgi:ELWxxDGT repeat protein